MPIITLQPPQKRTAQQLSEYAEHIRANRTLNKECEGYTLKGDKKDIISAVQRWEHAQENMDLRQISGHCMAWFNDCKIPQQIERYNNDAVTKSKPQHFTYIPSYADRRHLCIQDERGMILAYRVRLLPSELEMLVTADSWNPSAEFADPFTPTPPETPVVRHWALLSTSRRDFPHYSTDYNQDALNGARWWLDRLDELFDSLPNVLWNVAPEIYGRFVGLKVWDLLDESKSGRRPLCGAWHGCTLTQGQTSDGVPRLNANDHHIGYNCLTGWGSFESSRLRLWQLGVDIEVQPGDAVLYLGRIITHNIVAIGPRGSQGNFLECGTYDSNILWANDHKKDIIVESKWVEKASRDEDGPASKRGKLTEEPATEHTPSSSMDWPTENMEVDTEEEDISGHLKTEFSFDDDAADYDYGHGPKRKRT
ncbi:MAG: hypothetical protein M1819_003750 [Sarea resinae]|nr:MAG: hypothetical protein M1819_003750 [Sarea resinae]